VSADNTDDALEPEDVTPKGASAPEAGIDHTEASEEPDTVAEESASVDSAEISPSGDSAPSAESPDESTEEESAEAASDPLTEAMKTIGDMKDQLARANADYYNLSQEYNAYVRRSKQDGVLRREEGQATVIEALLPVLDDIALAREHGDLVGPIGQIAEKIEATLKTNFKVERFGAVGDVFDPQVHEALLHQTSPDATEETVGTLIQPGYRQGEKLLRPARVGVVSPE
jgi:molecular chaperone GrpE